MKKVIQSPDAQILIAMQLIWLLERLSAALVLSGHANPSSFTGEQNHTSVSKAVSRASWRT